MAGLGVLCCTLPQLVWPEGANVLAAARWTRSSRVGVVRARPDWYALAFTFLCRFVIHRIVCHCQSESHAQWDAARIVIGLTIRMSCRNRDRDRGSLASNRGAYVNVVHELQLPSALLLLNRSPVDDQEQGLLWRHQCLP